MTITEPTTMITDYVLALAAVMFAILVWRSHRFTRFSTRLWITGFIVTAAAAAAGGTYHGFALYFSDATHGSLWNATIALIAASSILITSAAFSGPLGRRGRNTPWLISGGLLTAAGAAVQLAGLSLHPSFNHNDLFHCMQTVALYLFFRGAQPVG
jgi:FlaA1/EpsC-like NDP-sugar epimerase